MKLSNHIATLFLAAAPAIFTACSDGADTPGPAIEVGKVDLEFENVAGNSRLQLNSTTPYTTAAGDQFTVTAFRYYISNIKLKKADGTEFTQPESYYLIDQENEASHKISVPNVPVGDYNSLTFTIGIDSARNVSGAQTGVLQPSDMFWTWNSGYIYTKLDGRYSQSGGGSAPIIFHIGGFKTPTNTIRTVSPAMNSNLIQVRTSRTPEVHLKADVLKMFTGPNTIRFAATNNVMGGANAVLVANNQAAGMFTIDHIHGN